MAAVMPLDQLLFWGPAKAIFAELANIAGRSVTQRALTALGKQPRQRALAEVLEETYAELVRHDRDHAGMLFDRHFLTHRGASVLARVLLPDPPPAAGDLLSAWHDQFGAESTRRDPKLLALCERFLESFRLKLRARDEFRPFFDSTALDAVRDELRAIRVRLEAPPDPGAQSQREAGDRFSTSIRSRFAELDAVVDRLTNDQYRVIELLHDHRRALISGCAGSGKTLVAAEKALRLDKAGVSTLFLCHSPLLADWVASLTTGSRVRVTTLERLVHDLVDDRAGASYTGTAWSNYSGPTAADLGAAFDVAVDIGPRYGAIIVDEGQDFADEWWTLVEGCLAHPDEAILYIFFDDAQSLLPFRRGDYPITTPPMNLSRNCRNAGEVYTLMRGLMPQTPEPEPNLAQEGLVHVQRPAADLAESVAVALRWLHEAGQLEGCVTLLGGGVAFEDSILARRRFRVHAGLKWREGVERELHECMRSAPGKGRARHAIESLMQELGEGEVTSADDVQLVKGTARRIQSSIWTPHHDRRTLAWNWETDTTEIEPPVPRLAASDGSTGYIYAADVLGFFAYTEWDTGLRRPLDVSFVRAGADGAPPTLPVHTVGDFKGLEAHAVLLVMQGRAP